MIGDSINLEIIEDKPEIFLSIALMNVLHSGEKIEILIGNKLVCGEIVNYNWKSVKRDPLKIPITIYELQMVITQETEIYE